MFQSSSAPKDGRYRMASGMGGVLLEFQSSLAPKDGRYNSVPSSTVSITARPEGRALHGDLCTGGLHTEVSILARPEGRALHVLYPDPRRAHAVSILARPEGRRYRRRRALASSLFMFQSSPAPKD